MGAVVIGYIAGQYRLNEGHNLRPQAHESSTHSSFGSENDFSSAIEELRRTFASEDSVSTDPDDLHRHGFSTNDYHPGRLRPRLQFLKSLTESLVGASHSVIVYPESTEDVVKIVKIATKYKMPITPYSGGTALEGHFSAVSHFSATLYYVSDSCAW